MSAISRTTASAGTDAPRKTYIAMRNYNLDFFSYFTSTADYVTTGTLGPVVGANSGNCLQGAFLRETGRRLYPGANPGISTLMVGVFDYSTGLKGFIDPNSFAFTPQNSDRSYYIDSAGYNPNTNDAPNQSDQGPPVYTHGDVLADGNLFIGGNASTIGNVYVEGDSLIQGNASTMGSLYVQGNISTTQTLYAGGGEIVSGRVVYNTITSYTSPSSGNPFLTIDCAVGDIFNVNIAAGTNWTLDGTNIVPGQKVTVVFNNVFVASNNFTPTVSLGGSIWETAALVLTANRPASLQLLGYYEPRTGVTTLIEIGRASNIVPV